MAHRVTFTELYDVLTGEGLHVGIADALGGGHDVVVSDPAGDRLVRLTVAGGFDQTAAVLVASMRLRETIGGLPELLLWDREVRGEWPEFERLWPVEFRAGTAE